MKDPQFLYCYKMTHDTGFAPNPYNGVLTLATCKPTIRRCAKPNYWISGWTSNNVKGKESSFKFTDKTQRLIYLAKVADVIRIDDYWNKCSFKRPINCNHGDNIYEPCGNGFIQHDNEGNHGQKNIKRDLSGCNVLICDEFYYFGVENAIRIETEKDFVVPRLIKLSLEDAAAMRIINQVTMNYATGINPKHI